MDGELTIRLAAAVPGHVRARDPSRCGTQLQDRGARHYDASHDMASARSQRAARIAGFSRGVTPIGLSWSRSHRLVLRRRTAIFGVNPMGVKQTCLVTTITPTQLGCGVGGIVRGNAACQGVPDSVLAATLHRKATGSSLAISGRSRSQ